MIDWYPNFNLWRHNLQDGPIYIRIYEMPFEFWELGLLETVGSNLGTVRSVDEVLIDRCRGAYIRMCLGVNLQHSLPSIIKIPTTARPCRLKVEREDQLPLCPLCKSIMHGHLECNGVVKVDRANKYTQKLFRNEGKVTSTNPESKSKLEVQQEHDPIAEYWFPNGQPRGERDLG